MYQRHGDMEGMTPSPLQGAPQLVKQCAIIVLRGLEAPLAFPQSLCR